MIILLLFRLKNNHRELFMTMKQKLPLMWIGKDKAIKVEPLILVHDGTKDYENKTTDNMLFMGKPFSPKKAFWVDFGACLGTVYEGSL